MTTSNVYPLVLFIELVVLSIYAHQARDILRSSGFNDTSTVERVWSRAREICLQPVAQPLLFACMMHFGAFALLYKLATIVTEFVGIKVNPNYDATESALVTAPAAIATPIGGSAFLALVVYRVSGGTHRIFFILAAIASLVFWNIDFIAPQFDGLECLIPIELPFYAWAAFKPLPATARRLRSSYEQPKSAGLCHTMFHTLGLIVIPRSFAVCVNDFADRGIYIHRLAASVSYLVEFSGSAVASVMSVKSALLAEHYQWQWRAFLVPAVPSLCVGIVLAIASALPDKEYPDADFRAFIYTVAGDGFSGVLGVYLYLKLAENAAAIHTSRNHGPRRHLMETQLKRE